MAYQSCDTFDHYNTPSLFYESSGGSLTFSSSFARFPAIPGFPNQGMKLGGNSFIRKNLKSNQVTLIAFMSFGAVAMPGSTAGRVMSFLDNGTEQIAFRLKNDGSLQFFVGNSANTPLGPSSAIGLISPSSAPNHGIEILVTFDATAGVIQAWLDGVQIINSSGLNTKNTANAFAGQFQIGDSSTSQGIYTDYWRVWDATGASQNAPLGLDRRKLTKLPSGAGDLAQWTPNGAAANWQCVDENPPDNDTTFVSSNGANSDSYAMPSAALSGAGPSMVVAKSLVRKDDTATRSVQVGTRSSAVNGLGPAVTVGSSYAFADACIATDPATGVAWTAAGADTAQHLKFESA
jgi:hypothetical protein